MNIIQVDEKNIEKEHICCAISDKKGECCVSSKKTWLKERFAEGLAFHKLDARGKVFIEYIPAENAWAPIDADNYLYINCFWVSGQFKGQGYANQLMDKCIEAAKQQGKSGVVALSSSKKMPFLSDPKYLKHKGFSLCDKAEPYFELLYLPLSENASKPKFKQQAKMGKIDEQGFVLFYTNQCPHTEKYAPLIANMAKEKGYALRLEKIEDKVTAQAAPTPFTTYSLYYNGKFVTNEILSEKRFEKIISELI